MKVLKEKLDWKTLYISTPKYLKEFNNKTIIQPNNKLIDKFNNINIGEVYYFNYLYNGTNLNQKNTKLILNGDIQLFSKRVVIDKKLKLIPYDLNEYCSLTSIETIDENGERWICNVNNLHTKESIKTTVKSSLQYLRHYYSDQLLQYDKILNKRKYTNREKTVQGLDNLINNLDKLFI